MEKQPESMLALRAIMFGVPTPASATHSIKSMALTAQEKILASLLQQTPPCTLMLERLHDRAETFLRPEDLRCVVMADTLVEITMTDLRQAAAAVWPNADRVSFVGKWACVFTAESVGPWSKFFGQETANAIRDIFAGYRADRGDL